MEATSNRRQAAPRPTSKTRDRGWPGRALGLPSTATPGTAPAPGDRACSGAARAASRLRSAHAATRGQSAPRRTRSTADRGDRRDGSRRRVAVDVRLRVGGARAARTLVLQVAVLADGDQARHRSHDKPGAAHAERDEGEGLRAALRAGLGEGLGDGGAGWRRGYDRDVKRLLQLQFRLGAATSATLNCCSAGLKPSPDALTTCTPGSTGRFRPSAAGGTLWSSMVTSGDAGPSTVPPRSPPSPRPRLPRSSPPRGRP